jgi:hypothetical protein
MISLWVVGWLTKKIDTDGCGGKSDRYCIVFDTDPYVVETIDRLKPETAGAEPSTMLTTDNDIVRIPDKVSQNNVNTERSTSSHHTFVGMCIDKFRDALSHINQKGPIHDSHEPVWVAFDLSAEAVTRLSDR